MTAVYARACDEHIPLVYIPRMHLGSANLTAFRSGRCSTAQDSLFRSIHQVGGDQGAGMHIATTATWPSGRNSIGGKYEQTEQGE